MPEPTTEDRLPTGSEPLKAVLWDMDGTIVDTEPYWMKAEAELTARFDVPWGHEQAMGMVGLALPNAAALLQATGVKLSVRDIIDFLLGEVVARVAEHVPWRPGARELLEDLRAHGVRCVMVTMSEAPLARSIAEALPAPYFEYLVTGDMVSAGKPDPEAYHLALAHLRATDPEIGPENVLVLEDSVPGVTAGLNAGLRTIGIPHMVPLPEFEGPYSTWETLVGKDTAAARQLLGASVSSR